MLKQLRKRPNWGAFFFQHRFHGNMDKYNQNPPKLKSAILSKCSNWVILRENRNGIFTFR